MLFSRPTPVLRNDTQTIIRIKVPWYEPFDVETKYFGSFKIQLTSVAVDETTTVIQIAGYPLKTKNTPKDAARPLCGLSGAFETQVQAIEGWEKGFVVIALENEQTRPVADALVKAMLKKRQAELVEIHPEVP
jgi:hypothetical protein